MITEFISIEKEAKLYSIKKELWKTDGKDPGTIMEVAYNKQGDYIGTIKDAKYYCDKRGIAPIKSKPQHCVCSIGFCEREQKWYGWSHRAIYGFGVGDVVDSADHLCACSGWTDEYLKEHPEADESLPIGFTAKTLDDCKKMAVAFAESVS